MPERYRCADDIAWVDGSDFGDPVPVAWASRVPDGSPVTLEGPAWLVWVALTELAEGGTLQEIVEEVRLLRGPEATTDDSELVGDAVEARGVDAFLAQLCEAGLVERVHLRPTGTI